MIKKLINFCKDEEGASMVEYGLLVALIAVLCIGAIQTLSGGIQTTFNTAAEHLGS
jgi:pilus assembly protein Flp/PilA